jgi:hypothetical protein
VTLEARPGRCTDRSGNDIGRLCFPCLLEHSPHDLTRGELTDMDVPLMAAIGELRQLLFEARRDREHWFRAWLSMTQRRVAGGSGAPATYEEAGKTWWRGVWNGMRGHRGIRVRPTTASSEGDDDDGI